MGENLCRHKKHVVSTVSDQPSCLCHPVGIAPFASCLVKSPRGWHPGNAGGCQQLGMVTCSPPLIPTVNARANPLAASASESNVQLHVPRFLPLNI